MTDELATTLAAAVNGQAPATHADATRYEVEAALLREAMRWSPFFRRRRVCRAICVLRGDPIERWWHHKKAAEFVLAAIGRAR